MRPASAPGWTRVRRAARVAPPDADHSCGADRACRAGRGRQTAPTSRGRGLAAGHRSARAFPVDQAGLQAVLRAHGRRRGNVDGRRAAVRAAAPRLDPASRPASASPDHHTGRHRCRSVRLLLRVRVGRAATSPSSTGRSATCSTSPSEGNGPLVVATTLANGFGEEVFFRGAIYAALECRPRCRRLDRRLHLGDRVDPKPRPHAGSWRDGHALQPATPCLRRAAGAGADPPHLVSSDGSLPASPVPARPGATRLSQISLGALRCHNAPTRVGASPHSRRREGAEPRVSACPR